VINIFISDVSLLSTKQHGYYYIMFSFSNFSSYSHRDSQRVMYDPRFGQIRHECHDVQQATLIGRSALQRMPNASGYNKSCIQHIHKWFLTREPNIYSGYDVSGQKMYLHIKPHILICFV